MCEPLQKLSGRMPEEFVDQFCSKRRCYSPARRETQLLKRPRRAAQMKNWLRKSAPQAVPAALHSHHSVLPVAGCRISAIVQLWSAPLAKAQEAPWPRGGGNSRSRPV